MQWTAIDELFKLTTPKSYIFMPFVDTTSHLETKPCNLNITRQGNSKRYDQHGSLGQFLWVVRKFCPKIESSGGDWLDSLLMTMQCLEQPRLHWVCESI